MTFGQHHKHFSYNKDLFCVLSTQAIRIREEELKL